MNRTLAALVTAALAGCATSAPGPGQDPAVPTVRAVQLARVRCLLVAPLENASDEPLVADAATGALVSAIDQIRTRVYPIDDLRALFEGTPLELPEGVSASLALELGEVLAADAVLYGAVEGRTRGPEADVTLTLRLAASGVRDTLFSRSVRVEPREGEPLVDASRRAALEALEPIRERMGVPGRKVCFERQRLDRVRVLAQSGEKPPAPPPAASPPAPAAAPLAAPAAASAPASAARTVAAVPLAAPGPAAPVGAGLTGRQEVWARKLSARERFIVEDVAFVGRSPRFARESGLADLARALAASPRARIRLEGFVDQTKSERQDLKDSMELARAAGRKLFELGVARDRVTWAGRGGDSPLSPSFSARGRASNRRIEVVSQ